MFYEYSNFHRNFLRFTPPPQGLEEPPASPVTPLHVTSSASALDAADAFSVSSRVSEPRGEGVDVDAVDDGDDYC